MPPCFTNSMTPLAALLFALPPSSKIFFNRNNLLNNRNFDICLPIGISNVIGLTLGTIQVLLYAYYRRADRKTDIEGAVVRENLGRGRESLVGSAPVIELVEVGGRLVEVLLYAYYRRPTGKPTLRERLSRRIWETIQVLLYAYYRRPIGKPTLREVVQEDLGGGRESLVGSAPVIELVEVAGRLVEVAEGGVMEVAEGRQVEEAGGG
ncbi:hypothetical protein TSUD_397890 [Trifolium subterraneum]|uniref:Bidirectional sugar transporter SWEET n=1 Tax=Trifolium subterraneum TaxID=3900 RepID=A0A2Z6NAP0_TRISU|nr:hypothetical protein TSUD_397890 [Trifolium subterraneum]